MQTDEKDIKDTQDYFRIRADKYSVIGELQHSRNVFVISGYIPEEDCEKLERLCERVSVCYVEFGDVDEEKAPVKLKNSRFAAPAESIVNMYSPPSHDDIDPTPLLAFFFYFFFGMMFSDAGYGLLMVIGTGLVIKLFKPDKEMRNTLKLFQYCGVSTFSGDLFCKLLRRCPRNPLQLLYGCRHHDETNLPVANN